MKEEIKDLIAVGDKQFNNNFRDLTNILWADNTPYINTYVRHNIYYKFYTVIASYLKSELWDELCFNYLEE